MTVQVMTVKVLNRRIHLIIDIRMVTRHPKHRLVAVAYINYYSSDIM